MATTTPDVHVVLAPQGFGHPALTMTSSNPTIEDGQQPLASTPDIIRGDNQGTNIAYFAKETL